ncbi:hypothetical protein [Amycolatopsis sp. NPDC003731]
MDKPVAAWRYAVRDGSDGPGFVDIPSGIGQVAAVRALAALRREPDTAHAICSPLSAPA